MFKDGDRKSRPKCEMYFKLTKKTEKNLKNKSITVNKDMFIVHQKTTSTKS